MTRETWTKHNMPTEYIGKHASPAEYQGKHAEKLYNVWRVYGPSGPEETIYVLGWDNAKKAVSGCWDYEVTTMEGDIVL